MDTLINKMSLKQKVGQINQYLFGWECYEIHNGQVKLSTKLKTHILEYDGIGAIYGLFRADPWAGVSYENGLTYNQSIDLINNIREFVQKNCSLPIMPLIVEEMPHGHQGLGAKCYPVNLAIGASFNPELYSLVLQEQQEYANAHGINVALISGLDVARDSRWGRTEETFGADPYLSSEYTRQIPASFNTKNTVACLKHFVAQGAPYMGLNSAAVNIGERELREIHLPPTKKAIDNGLEFIMAAYNEIDGIPCHANRWLLQNVLRKEMKFPGIIMADGQALNRLRSTNTSTSAAAKLAIEAGIGLSLWDDVFLNLDKAVMEGVVDESLLDRQVFRMMQLKEKLNLLTYSKLNKKKIAQDDQLNYKIATESIILQKNIDNYLPINITDSCLFIGDSFDNLYTFLGDYTAYQDTEKYPNLQQLISSNMKNARCVTYNQALKLTTEQLDSYKKVFVIGGGTSAREFDMEFEENGALKHGNQLTDSGENVDVGSISLTDIQYEVCKILKEKAIHYAFICIQGRPYALKNVAFDAMAILSVYYNGQQGSQAILDTMLGINNPSGKNPISMPYFPEYFEFEYNSKQDNRNKEYVRSSSQIFEFGHGLSYSDVKYNCLRIKEDNIYVEVENTSNLDSNEVIQVYVKKENSVIVKRLRDLVAFKKTCIPANSKLVVCFEIENEWFETFDINMKKHIECGHFHIIVGTGTQIYLEQSIVK